MYRLHLEDWQELLVYSDIFEGSIPDIKEEIKKFDLGKAISIICELLAVRNMTVKQIMDVPYIGKTEVEIPYQLILKREFCNIRPQNSQELFSDGRMKKNRHIIALQPMLILLKTFLAYSDEVSVQNTTFEVTEKDYAEIIRLQLIVADNMQYRDSKQFDADNFIYCNYHVNNDHNVAAEIVRSYYMLEKLDCDIDLFPDDVKGEYKDYRGVFKTKYGYSIAEYIFSIFRELELYIGRENYISYKSFWLNPIDVYAGTNMTEIARNVLKNLSTNISELRTWCVNTIDEPWNFKIFLETPFIASDNEKYITISEYTLKNSFFENLFWNIKACYPETENRIMAFYGRLYERYIQDHIENLLLGSSDYRYISEFSYGRRNGRKSSDAYIKKGTKLLAIEAKGFSVLFDSILNKSIERNLEKLYIKPILQADTAFANNTDRDDFSDVTELYIVSVTMDNINAVPNYVNKCIKIINEKKHTAVLKAFFNFSIEELEMLLFTIENGEDAFELLADYFLNENLMPFSNYIRQRTDKSITMTSFMKKIYEEFTSEMKLAYWKE